MVDFRAQYGGRGYTPLEAVRLNPRPEFFTCPGITPDGRPCGAELTLRATASLYVRPYFAVCPTHPHSSGCPQVSMSRSQSGCGTAAEGGGNAGRRREYRLLSDAIDLDRRRLPPRARESATLAHAGGHRATASDKLKPRATSIGLTRFLAALKAGKIDPGTLVDLGGNVRGRIADLVLSPSDSHALMRAIHSGEPEPTRAIYGTVDEVLPPRANLSLMLRLRPTSGPRTLTLRAYLTRECQMHLQEHLATQGLSLEDLPGKTCLAIGTVRRSSTRNHLYLQIRDRNSLVFLHE